MSDVFNTRILYFGRNLITVKSLLRSFSLTLLFSVIATYSIAVTTTATGNGNWSNTGTWDNGVPGCGDYVVIPAGIVVTITSTVNLDENSSPACSTSTFVEVAGTLAFQTGKKLHLACGSNVYILTGGNLVKGNGGGNSNIVEVCDTVYWKAGDGNVSGPSTIGPGPPLPIVLAYFKAEMQGDQVNFRWKTLSEINNDYFTIERSTDLTDIESLFEIEGAGNSRRELNYEAIDPDPLQGFSYYRLKQTDYDGSFSYSSWVAVNYSNDRKEFEIVNDISGRVYLKSNGFKDEMIKCSVLDMNGRIHYEKEYRPQNDLELFDLADLPVGPYIILINTSDKSVGLKFIRTE